MYNNPERIPTRCRIAVPPGVGDVYWCLTKLGDFRRKNNLEHVTLCVQKSQLTRALAWSKMVPELVNSAVEYPFKRNAGFESTGFSKNLPGVSCVMWPNAIVDKGQHLSKWLPRYELDLNIHIKTTDPLTVPEIVVYASAEGVNNAWLPGKGPQFWSNVLEAVADIAGEPATLIGAGWDAEFAKQITGPHKSLIGQTDLLAVAGVLKRAKLVIGIISGMTILANHFGTPALAIWPDHHFPKAFPYTWTRPGISYLAMPASKVTDADQVVRTAVMDMSVG